jgi:hypothetical protein
MKIKISIACFAFSLLGVGAVQAQEAVLPSGGDATGSGGSSSYSVGQVVYTTNTAGNGSVAQGVQQPYEISVIDAVASNVIDLDLVAFPNPTSNFLTLTVGDYDQQKLTYELYDSAGKLLDSNRLTGSSTTIKMQELPTATYFLKVSDGKQTIKTFKIIKS